MMLSFRVGRVGVQKLAIRGKRLSDMSDKAGVGRVCVCACVCLYLSSLVVTVGKGRRWTSSG